MKYLDNQFVGFVSKRKNIEVFMDSRNGEVGVDMWLITVVTPRRRLELELLNNPQWRPF